MSSPSCQMQGVPSALDAVFVPGAVRRQHEIIARPASSCGHRRRYRRPRPSMMKRIALAEWRCAPATSPGFITCKPGINPAHRRRHIAAAPGCSDRSPAAPPFPASPDRPSAAHARAGPCSARPPAPIALCGCPGFDLVGHGPQRAGVEPVQFVVIGQKFGRIFDIGATDDILAVVFMRSWPWSDPSCCDASAKHDAGYFRKQPGFSKIMGIAHTSALIA